MTSRDAALLTWIGLGTLLIAWSLMRDGGFGRSALGVLQAFVAPRILGMVVVTAAWLILVVSVAALVDLWKEDLLKDTIVIVAIGSVMTGFKALSLMKGEQTMRDEVRSLFAVVVVIQFVSNLETFPYLVELILIPLAALLGGMQAVAKHDSKYQRARPLINIMIAALGWAFILWSVYKIVATWGSAQWHTVGLSFALGFWLPAALLPAIYLAALAMQYGQTISMIKVVSSPSFSARLDLYRHHGVRLGRLRHFSRSRSRAYGYAKAASRDERLAILRAPAKD